MTKPPANIRPIAAMRHPTTFRPGQSGNPAGRRRGTRNRVTVEAREAAQRIVDDPVYREELRQRMIDGTAGAMEPLMWFYAKGRPQSADDRSSNVVAHLSDGELSEKLAEALTTLTTARHGRG